MNIQAVARRTGIPSATLRKWEQRYGVLKPDRTPGAHRRYSERDILRVEWLKARLDEGYRIGEAARLLGGATGTPPRDASELVADLVAATVAPDPERAVHSLDQAFALLSYDKALGDVVEPALGRIGDLWSVGEATVAEEHHMTEMVRGKLRSLLDGGTAGSRGRAVLACVPGERHECGLLGLAVLMHADGWGIVYLGADTPLDTAFSLADSLDTELLCLSATMPAAAADAELDLERLSSAYPHLGIVRGGAAWAEDETPAAALDRVRQALAVHA